jgi:hypothetical protein
VLPTNFLITNKETNAILGLQQTDVIPFSTCPYERFRRTSYLYNIESLSLTTIYIGGNKINHVPTEISALKELQVISFSCNEGNLVLPKELCSLHKLKKLYLYSPSGSVTLPVEINELPLQEVGISYFNPWPTSVNNLADVIKVQNHIKVTTLTSYRFLTGLHI